MASMGAKKSGEGTRGKSRGDDVAAHTLCIDIGGTGLKALVLDAQGKPLTDRVRVETPRPATPKAVMRALVGARSRRSARSIAYRSASPESSSTE